jgi:GT2 family glycosyltransferase
MGWVATGLAENIPYWLKNYNLTLFAPQKYRPVSYARNFCGKTFLESDHDVIWFVDDAVVPSKASLEMLLQADKLAISGVARVPKVDSDGITKAVGMVLRKTPEGYKEAVGRGVERIDAAGFGCMLLRREVFERIEFPWFSEIAWGNFRGEDFGFCEKMKAVGIQLWVHFSVDCKKLVEAML